MGSFTTGSRSLGQSARPVRTVAVAHINPVREKRNPSTRLVSTGSTGAALADPLGFGAGSTGADPFIQRQDRPPHVLVGEAIQVGGTESGRVHFDHAGGDGQIGRAIGDG